MSENELIVEVDIRTPSQGSMKTFPFRRKNGKLGASTIHAKAKDIQHFRDLVQARCKEIRDAFYVDSNDMGYVVEFFTYLTKPPSNKTKLPTKKGSGDIDKLGRAILDALTLVEIKNPYGIFNDDSAVIHLEGTKLWCESDEPEHTKIKITKILNVTEFIEKMKHGAMLK